MSLAFLIPVIHPGARTVADYDAVERMLGLTVRAVLRQTAGLAGIVVIAHRYPDWAVDDPRLRVIALPDRAGLGPDVRPSRIDKAIKQSLAALIATELWDPAHLMLMDADDFVAIDLGETLSAGAFGPGGADGFLIRRGWHVVIRQTAGGVALRAAYLVNDFDKSCGTCRIFRTSAQLERIRQIVPPDVCEGVALAAGDKAALDAVLDALLAEAGPGDRPAAPILDLVGRHIMLDGHLDLAPIDAPMAAKACGHDNHTGFSGASVSWNRVRGNVPVAGVAARLGVDRDPEVTIDQQRLLPVLAARVRPPISRLRWQIERAIGLERTLPKNWPTP